MSEIVLCAMKPKNSAALAVVDEKTPNNLSASAVVDEKTPNNLSASAVVAAGKDVSGEEMVVMAIDFGSAQSAVALALRNDPQNVIVAAPLSLPVATSGGLQAVAPDFRAQKAPSVVLLLADEPHALVAFGEKAAEMYNTTGMNKDGSSNGKFLLFEYFKMTLAPPSATDAVARTQLGAKKIAARCGRTLPLLKVLTETIRHLKNTGIARLGQGKLDEQKDMLFILTVPTQWDHAANEMMRKAAEAAGIPADHTRLALESESAAVECHRLVTQYLSQKYTSPTEPLSDAKTPPMQAMSSVSEFIGVDEKYLKVGQKWLELDWGGGTVDVTLFEVDVDGRLSKAQHSGGAWGSRVINNEIEQTLDKAFGGRNMRIFERKCPGAAQTLSDNIELLKRSIVSTNEGCRLKVPDRFMSFSGFATKDTTNVVYVLKPDFDPTASRGRSAPASNVNTITAQRRALSPAGSGKDSDSDDEFELLGEFKLPNLECYPVKKPPTVEPDISYCKGYIRFSAKIVASWFAKITDPVIGHLHSIFEKERTLSGVYGVGGMCDSRVIRNSITNQIQLLNKKHKDKQVQLVFPQKADLCVIRGAVQSGMFPDRIRSRVLRQTYGREDVMSWNDEAHHLITGLCERIPRQCVRINSAGRQTLVSDDACHDHFKALVRAGDLVNVNEEIKFIVRPSNACQHQMDIRFYCTNLCAVVRTDQAGVHYIGRITVDMPNDEGGMNRQVEIALAFGGPQIIVKATDLNSNNAVKAKISFLD